MQKQLVQFLTERGHVRKNIKDGQTLTLKRGKKKQRVTSDATIWNADGTGILVFDVNSDDLQYMLPTLKLADKTHHILVVVEHRGKRRVLKNTALSKLPADLMKKLCGNEELRILAFDPGSANMGWSFIKADSLSISLVAGGMISAPVNDLRGAVGKRLDAFLAEVATLYNTFKPNSLILERYMTRGIKGDTIECVNLMIGAIMTRFKFDRMKCIPASQWKNEFNKRHNLEEHYKAFGCEVHQVDSMYIGVYGAHHWLMLPTYSTLDKQVASFPKLFPPKV